MIKMARGRPPKPVALLKAEGKSHYTKKDLADKEKRELKVDLLDVEPPATLNKSLHNRFNELATQLLDIDILTELDEDLLARYVIAQKHYEDLTSKVNGAMRRSDIHELDKLHKIQDRAFKQAHACARELGLTITSRARLVVPEAEVKSTNKFKKNFGKGKQ